jgi:hypothetical protein
MTEKHPLTPAQYDLLVHKMDNPGVVLQRATEDILEEAQPGLDCPTHGLAFPCAVCVRAPKALRSFYGASDRQKKANTVKSMACPGARPQEILTPRAIIDLLPWPVELDPCACVGSLVPAKVCYYGQPEDEGGLILPWMDRTYCNPPYKDLKAWLERAQREHLRLNGQAQFVMLAPVRTHRAWFRSAMAAGVKIKWLDPVKFHGYDQAFPAPLCLLGWGF